MTNRSPVTVLIPTRGRPQCFKDAIESVWRTSSAWVVAYQDLDSDLAGYPTDGYKLIHGKRVGVSGALNAMAQHVMEERPWTEVLAMMTDDSLMMTPRWDDFAVSVARRFHKGIGVISPRSHKCGVHRVDQPAVTMGWFKHYGYFAYKEVGHYCWPNIIGLTSERLCLYKCSAQEWEIEHRQVGGRDSAIAYDSERFYEWVSWHMEEARSALEQTLVAVQ